MLCRSVKRKILVDFPPSQTKRTPRRRKRYKKIMREKHEGKEKEKRVLCPDKINLHKLIIRLSESGALRGCRVSVKKTSITSSKGGNES